LTKLGLSHKPNVSHPLPKQFIWETIYRVDGGRMIPNNAFGSSGKNLDQKTIKLRAFASPGSHLFNGRGGRTDQRSERDPSHHKYRSPFDFTFNISKNNVYGKVLRNRSLERIDKKNSFLNGWTENRQLKINSQIASMPTELKSHHNSSPKELKSGAVRKVNGINGTQMNENALKKSTYPIDINHSIDNKTHTGKNGEMSHNDYEYFNDYSVQTHDKNRYHEGRSSIGYQPAIHNIEYENQKGHHESFADDHENIDHEDFFGNTQEIITFAEEGE